MDYFPSCNPNHPSMLTSGGRDTKNKTKRGNGAAMKLSTDPQSVAARERRHRISHRFKILQSLVPGGSSKMDTVSTLDQAIHYVKFLKTQIWLHQAMLRRCVDDDPSLFLPTNSLLTQPDLFSLINVGSAQVHQVSQVAVPNCYIQDDQEAKPYDPPIMY